MNYKCFLSWIVFYAFISLWSACIDREFDEPPVTTNTIPFDNNSSIAELKSKWVTGKVTDIVDDLLIHAFVIANDSTGNFFRKIVVQDSTGGMEIEIDRDNDLHKLFPVGMKVGIKCKGLSIGDYAGLPQLGQGKESSGGFDNVGRIPGAVLGNYIFSGPIGPPFLPAIRTFNSLTSLDLNTLVRLDNMEFMRSELGKTYANAVGKQSANLNLVDCNKNELVLRTSGFASFASELIPDKNGYIVAVFGKFNSTPQLVIRDLNDINFTNDPCLGGGGNVQLVTISEVRNLFSGSTLIINQNYKIKATITSDRTTANINARNLYMQDASAGILVRFTGNHTYNIGDEIEIIVNGIELSAFNELLQLNNVPNVNATLTSTGNTVTPKELTIQQINDQFESLEAQLVLIKQVTLTKSSGNTYSQSVIATDPTGNITLFTATAATFANALFPTQKVNITAIVSQFTSKQIIIRNENDVMIVGGGSGGAVLKSLAEVRSLYTGSKINITEDIKIRGVLTSDKDPMNIHPQNIFLQDSSAAIMIRFTANHSFNLGDELEINIKGLELSEFNFLLQLNNTPNVNATLIGTGKSVTAKSITIANLLSQFESYESQLITIHNVSLSKSGSTTFSGTVLVSDGVESLDMFTRTQASFALDNFPVTAVSITGQVSQFGAGSRQIVIRNLNDIK